MIIPNKLPGYPEYNYSFGSGQSSGGGPSRSSGRGGPIRRHSSSTDPSFSLPPVNELDDQHDVGALNRKLWRVLKDSKVFGQRKTFIMANMTIDENILLRDAPKNFVYRMAKEFEIKHK